VNYSNQTVQTISDLMTKNMNTGTMVDEIVTACRARSGGLKTSTGHRRSGQDGPAERGQCRQSVKTMNRVAGG